MEAVDNISELTRHVSQAQKWPIPCVWPSLMPDEVHVWRAQLNLTRFQVSLLYEILSDDEKRRAGRFHFMADRRCYVVARGTLRHIIGKYLACDPARITFSYNTFGKPSLAVPSVPASLKFNVSHSGELAVYALAYGREIGVDVERIREDIECEQLARRFFSSSEYQVLCDVVPAMRRKAFFNCWTRKEAFIKALGEGLSYPLSQFEVSGAPVQVLRAGTDISETGRWLLHQLSPAVGYVGALVVAPPCGSVRCWTWSEQ